MKPTNPTAAKTDSVKDEALASQLTRKPAAPPVPTENQGKAPLKTNDIVDAETGSEVGVEDEVAYVVAEGTPNGDLAGASGLFGGAAAAFGPAGLAAAGLAGLGLLAGSGGDGAAAPAPTPPAPPPIPPIDPPSPPPPPPPAAADSTGVVGATLAVSERAAAEGAPPELISGLNDFASQADSGADGATAIPGAGPAANNIVGQVESDGSPAGVVGGLGTLADSDPTGTFSADMIQTGAEALPISMLASMSPDPTLAEIVTDIYGDTGASASTASRNEDSPVDLLTSGAASTISSAADTLGAGLLPTPPAV